MSTDAIFYGSIACYLLAASLFAWWIVRKVSGWLEITREMRKEAEARCFDPVRSQPDWMKNAHIGVDYARPGSERTTYGVINPKTGELEIVIRKPKKTP